MTESHGQVVPLPNSVEDVAHGDVTDSLEISRSSRDIHQSVVPAHLYTIRERVHGVIDGFDDVNLSVWWNILHRLVSYGIIVFILGSVCAVFFETLPQFVDGHTALEVTEIVSLAVFSIEIIVRGWATPDRCGFIRSPLTWIDILAVLPSYVFFAFPAIQGFSGVRTLRLLRCLRIVKLVKNNIGFVAVVEALRTSKEALWLMILMVLLAGAIASSGVYFAELENCSFDKEREEWVRANGEKSPFQSIFHAFWWCIITITTVGYGDEVPVTPIGKLIAAFTAFCGVFVISFPTAILGATFAEIHSQKLAEQKQRREGKERLIRDDSDKRRIALLAELQGKLLGRDAPRGNNPDGIAGRLPSCVPFIHEGAERSVWVLSEDLALTPPLLSWRRDVDGLLEFRRDACFPQDVALYTIFIVMCDEAYLQSAKQAIARTGFTPPGDMVVRPRELSRLTVSTAAAAVVADRHGLHLTTRHFDCPGGVVPLTFRGPAAFNVGQLGALQLDVDLSFSQVETHRVGIAGAPSPQRALSPVMSGSAYGA